jgi:hypothetical protein
MNEREAALADFEARIRRLEAENRWLKWSGVALVFALVGACVVGQSRPAESKTPARLEATSYALLDAAGNKCGALGVEEVQLVGRALGEPTAPAGAPSRETRSVLHLGGEQQTTTAVLTASSSYAGLSLSDASNASRLGIGIDADRTARMELDDLTGNPRLSLQVQPNGTGLVVLTAESGARAVLGATKKRTILQLSEEDGKARAEMGLTANKATWLTLLDRNGKRRIVLSVEADGPAKLQVLDADEKPIWSAP